MRMLSHHTGQRRTDITFRRGALALALILATACGGDGGTEPSRVASVEITGSFSDLEANSTTDLDATLLDAEGQPVTGEAVTWSSSDNSVATVNAQTGVVTGVDRGSVTITATAGAESDAVTLDVIILYRQIATGEFHSCDIASGGVVWCWGELAGGGTIEPHPVPVQLNTTLRFTHLNAGGVNTCGLVASGAAYCWGPNTDGQLGSGATNAGSKTPVAVLGGHSFRMISTESPVTCGVTNSSVGYCWGDNTEAQVNATSDATSPVIIPGGYSWAMVDVGANHACGVTTTGAAYCWGSDANGQLGDGGTISYNSLDTNAAPVLVAGGHTWLTISSGQYFTCGLTTAGVAYCWGRNDSGRLGNGDLTDTDRSSPVAVSGGLTFNRIDAGRYHTCALTAGNLAYCWGANNLGQYGVASPTDISRVPVAGGGGLEFSEISASDLEHTCGITSERAIVVCFGRNDTSQLGNNTTTSSTTRNPTPVFVNGQEPYL